MSEPSYQAAHSAGAFGSHTCRHAGWLLNASGSSTWSFKGVNAVQPSSSGLLVTAASVCPASAHSLDGVAGEECPIDLEDPLDVQRLLSQPRPVGSAQEHRVSPHH
ncbi:hypothetical protein EYF80_020506 [Liparis tanakae]|uniref:Uncharacterized protein n=1 Tax=Liparis tanakae TaxID=230148 RepID=A0A4Z2HTP6_9TELE|nr:hypothetical protein EYF80_020506 [Liparis tanakae]